ncbi:hypothetical protein CPLU01_07979 [Colletotrichum plurivorum]|uniref:Uncharacterized protein n=1 Tax=Colletotrichum plurivorum TaxID=2175906 RepID=A0A8H6NDB0_9PEZI|nr:hypothetical protein CPLU01_07979 [Colletotrichum plurivorum]
MSHTQQFNSPSTNEQRPRPRFFTPHATPTLGRGNSAPASLHGMIPAHTIEPNNPQPATPSLENLTLSSRTPSTPGCATPASSAADEYFWEKPLESQAKDAATADSSAPAASGEPKPSATFYSGDHELGYPHRNPRPRAASAEAEIDTLWTVPTSDIVRRSFTGSAKEHKPEASGEADVIKM